MRLTPDLYVGYFCKNLHLFYEEAYKEHLDNLGKGISYVCLFDYQMFRRKRDLHNYVKKRGYDKYDEEMVTRLFVHINEISTMIMKRKEKESVQ